jgi:hypothetical protein
MTDADGETVAVGTRLRSTASASALPHRQTPKWRRYHGRHSRRGAEARTARSRLVDDAMVIIGERLGLRAHGVTVTAAGLTASSWA